MVRRMGKVLGTLAALPFFLLLLPFVLLAFCAMYVVALPTSVFHFRRWKRTLRVNGRIISPEGVCSAEEGGTLIVDRPGYTWGTTHCWWTTDRVADCAPVAIPTDDERMNLCKETSQTAAHPFHAWCWNRYLSPATGTAKLVATRQGESAAKRIRKRTTAANLVYSWSAPAQDEARAQTNRQQK